MAYLYILRGLPGSGKTSLAITLAKNISDAKIFAADDYFVDKSGNYNFDSSKLHEAHKACLNKTIDALLSGSNNVFVTNTFTTKKELKPYLELKTKLKIPLIIFIITVENLHQGKSVHNVPDSKLQQMQQRYEIFL